MGRVRVQSYKPSKSARVLARYLGVKRIKTRGSRFRGRPSDVIINWGNVKTVHNSKYLNPIEAVKIASNKLATFRALEGLPIPEYTTDPEQAYTWLLEGKKVVIRKDLYGHSGRGIVVLDSVCNIIPSAPLYVKFIDKVAEYRVIVVNGKAIDVKEKKKKRGWEDERDPYIWNHSNGYVFARNVSDMPSNLATISVEAVERLGLITGAVDIIKNSEGKLKVLEINTAYGLEGTTVELVGDAIKEVVEELRRRY